MTFRLSFLTFALDLMARVTIITAAIANATRSLGEVGGGLETVLLLLPLGFIILDLPKCVYLSGQGLFFSQDSNLDLNRYRHGTDPRFQTLPELLADRYRHSVPPL